MENFPIELKGRLLKLSEDELLFELRNILYYTSKFSYEMTNSMEEEEALDDMIDHIDTLIIEDAIRIDSDGIEF